MGGHNFELWHINNGALPRPFGSGADVDSAIRSALTNSALRGLITVLPLGSETVRRVRMAEAGNAQELHMRVLNDNLALGVIKGRVGEYKFEMPGDEAFISLHHAVLAGGPLVVPRCVVRHVPSTPVLSAVAALNADILHRAK